MHSVKLSHLSDVFMASCTCGFLHICLFCIYVFSLIHNVPFVNSNKLFIMYHSSSNTTGMYISAKLQQALISVSFPACPVLESKFKFNVLAVAKVLKRPRSLNMHLIDFVLFLQFLAILCFFIFFAL